MKKNYIVLVLAILFTGITIAQETQKNYINYQGVARNADNALMSSEEMTINIALKFGNASATSVYEESHVISTDANGVFSLFIGNGSPAKGNYNTLPWGSAATFATVSLNGNEIGTSEMMSVPYAISSGKAIDQSAAEVRYDNSVSGLSAATAQDAIDELVTGGSVDADADPSNEFQTLSFDAATNELSLTDGNSVVIPSGGTDADADPTNEIQTISFDAASNKISLTDGGEITIPSRGTDADADPSNELQTLNFDAATNELSLSGGNTIVIPTGGVDGDGDSTNEIQTISFDAGTNELSLSNGGTVTIPSGGTDADADPTNEIDVTTESGILLGNGATVSGLVGTANGQVPKWDEGSNTWAAGTDATGSGGTSTGLEAIDEGNGIGWRLLGRNAANFGPIGLNAVDLSTSDSPSIVNGATGDYSSALGQETRASGIRSTAMGYSSKASGSVSFASGEETVASGEFAVAMGDRTRAIEQSSTALGAGTTASGTHSTALGNSTTASGGSSTAMGNNTRAESLSSFAVGRNNVGGGDAFLWQANDPLFEIGNGSETVANNALTVLKNGNTGIGVPTPTEKLEVAGTMKSTDLAGTGQRNVMADANGNLVIGSSGGGSSLWSENGDNIYFNPGNVGIGTDDPDVPLDIALESFISIKTTSATTTNYMQFDNSTGAVGYSGIWSNERDMDFGTNGSNTDGKVHLVTRANPKLTVATDGNVGIGNEDPTAKLDVDGDIKTSGEINRTSTGAANMVPIAYGSIARDSRIYSGSGNFTVNRESPGVYYILINGENYDYRTYTALATRNTSSTPGFIGSNSIGRNTLVVRSYSIDGTPTSVPFTFVIYKE